MHESAKISFHVSCQEVAGNIHVSYTMHVSMKLSMDESDKNFHMILVRVRNKICMTLTYLYTVHMYTHFANFYSNNKNDDNYMYMTQKYLIHPKDH